MLCVVNIFLATNEKLSIFVEGFLFKD